MNEEKSIDDIVNTQPNPHIIKIVVACTHSRSGDTYRVEHGQLIATAYLCDSCLVPYKRIVRGYLQNGTQDIPRPEGT